MQYIQHAHTHAFNGLFYGTIWVSWYQKGIKPVWINDARDDGVLGWQCHQLDHMQTICTSLQTDKHTNTPSLNFTGRMLFPMHNRVKALKARPGYKKNKIANEVKRCVLLLFLSYE